MSAKRTKKTLKAAAVAVGLVALLSLPTGCMMTLGGGSEVGGVVAPAP